MGPHDLDVTGTVVAPCETDPPLPVDSNAILFQPITFEGFQTIARQHPRGYQAVGDVQRAKPLVRQPSKPLEFARPVTNG
jgi:hypothetical protein